jgi:hypothetical protein
MGVDWGDGGGVIRRTATPSFGDAPIGVWKRKGVK